MGLDVDAVVDAAAPQTFRIRALGPPALLSSLATTSVVVPRFAQRFVATMRSDSGDVGDALGRRPCWFLLQEGAART